MAAILSRPQCAFRYPGILAHVSARTLVGTVLTTEFNIIFWLQDLTRLYGTYGLIPPISHLDYVTCKMGNHCSCSHAWNPINSVTPGKTLLMAFPNYFPWEKLFEILFHLHSDWNDDKRVLVGWLVSHLIIFQAIIWTVVWLVSRFFDSILRHLTSELFRLCFFNRLAPSHYLKKC